MSKKSDSEVFALLMVSLTLIVLIPIFNGWVLTYLWKWFIVPLGVKPLTVPWAIGISLVVAMLTHQTQTGEDDRSPWVILLTPIFAALILLAIGAIAHSFMGPVS